MGYIEKIFRKSKDELKISDLKNFFKTEQEETDVLEFKSGKVEIIDLYKEITAFLNTEGGLIIIGSPIEKKEKIGKKTKTICKGDLTYTKFRNSDWLYQKIMSNITPPPAGIKIFEHIDEKQGAIFMLDIPQSQIPPHQCCSDGRYYIRLEREAKPAPHGIVQALFQKRRLPKLYADIKISKENESSNFAEIIFRNKSNVPAEKFNFIIDVYNVEDTECNFVVNNYQDLLGTKFSIAESTDKILVQIISVPINLTVFHKNEEYIIFVGYWCRDMDFDYQFWTYNPLKNKIVCAESMNYKNKTFKDEIDRLSHKRYTT